ncbi:hypothetical protein TEA_019499 [Camellia sinensis var. sinensis]|uniref:Uncharacterized protein n=2 Tax=Camellia sinensis TaxID=4442 RepID=A0A4S4DBG7_CAMSN|nr:hypothetical protein TEA_019499 [Camellia sinensis var. sinensis]
MLEGAKSMCAGAAMSRSDPHCTRFMLFGILSAMASSTVVQRGVDMFRERSVEKIILVGVSGVGKTWTAKQLSKHAIKEGLFEIALWVFCNRKYHGTALSESIARQLSLLPIADEWEVEDKKGGKEEENHEDLQTMIAKSLEKKKVLLIFDDEGNKMKEGQIILELETLLNLPNVSSYKVLITSTNAPTGSKDEILVKPLSVEESLSLFRDRVGRRVYEDLVIKDLAEKFIKETKYFPAAIMLMAKAFSYFVQCDSGTQMLESALKETAESDSKNYNLAWLLHSGYDMLPRSVLIDCCRHGSRFFRNRGSIHYSELIAYWILEGYLGHVECMEKAYEKGHSVFMELVDCQLLKKLDSGYVVMDSDRAIVNLDDFDHCGFGGTSSLGLADLLEDCEGTTSLGLAYLFEDGEWEGFGRISQADGMIKSVCSTKMGQKLSTLFLNGNRCLEILDSFSGLEELQVLALFNPTAKSLTQHLSKMHQLIVLVLRGCDFLVEMDHKFELTRLTVLEISNASSLKTIPDDFFAHMLQLQSLHISELKVDHLPSSLYNLKELRQLILRGCSCFQTIDSLKNFKNLTVLDVSGATSLTKFIDKTFRHTPKLQTLNLSHTSINRIPKLKDLGQLTHLSLRSCKLLDRLPKTDLLTSLQTLDLSGAIKCKEFHEQSQKLPSDLKILDISQTPLEKLPFEINAHHLFIKHCLRLQKLPCIEALKDLEVLDLSGSSSLVEIEDQFFSHLSFLQILNLSKTGIKTLPSVSKLKNLRQLLLSGCIALTEIKDTSFEQMSCLQNLDLSDCTNLKALPPLETLSNLKELNLCGVSSLKKIGAGFLEHMSHLQILDLSETQIGWLPSMSNLKSLRQLSIRGCEDLPTVPNLEVLMSLEVLDLSGTGVTHIPSLENFSNLRQLLLRGCSNLKGFLHGEMIDLLGTTVKELPYGISKLTHLECLDLPHKEKIQGAESRNMKSLPEVDDPNQWSMSSFDNPHIAMSGIQFLQIFKKNPSLLETRFHLCVHPTKGKNKKGDTYSYRNDHIFRDILFRTAEFDCFKEQRSLEIHGFDLFPSGVGDVLCNADCVFFINNTFNKWFSDIGVSSLQAIKGCWIERCTKMEGVFQAGKEDDIAELGLEILGISNAKNLSSIYSGNLHCQSFQKLKCLYLDCCPKLSTVFSSSQLPENLKVLQVRFCDKLETVFEQSSPEPKLQNLETLCLWELPELTSVGCRLPSLQTLKVWECPKLQKLEDTIRLAESIQTLWISNVVDLKNIYSESRQLETLILESCPMLETIVTSLQQPQSPMTVKIKSCNKLKPVSGSNTLSESIMQ